MGRRKNNNPQKIGTRGPGRKSRKQEAPDAIDDGDGGIALGVHHGGSPSKTSPKRPSGREAKLRAQSLFNRNQGGVAALARKTKNLALTPPEVIVSPHEGEPLKSALKTAPSAKGTVSSTISKLERQRSNSAPKQGHASAERIPERKVKFSDSTEVREMTLSETEEDRQPLASTLMSILSSCMEAELGTPPARKRRKKKAILTTKKGQKGNKAKPKAAAGDPTVTESENDTVDAVRNDDEEDENDEFEIDVPVNTPMELLHAIVDLANARQAGSAEGDGGEADATKTGTKEELSNALAELFMKKSISPMKKKKNAGKSNSSVAKFDDEDDAGQSDGLLDDADINEIEKLNEQAVATATSSSLSPSRSSPVSKKSTDLAALLSDAAIDDDDTTSDEDFEPTAADFEQARRDALWKPGDAVDDDDTMEGSVEKTDAHEDVAVGERSAAETAIEKASSPEKSRSNKKLSLKLLSEITTPVKTTNTAEAAQADESLGGGEKNSASSTTSSSPAPKTVSPVKGRRSISANIEQQQQPEPNDAVDESVTSPVAAAAAAVQEEDDLMLSTTQSADSARPPRSTVLSQTHALDDMKANRMPEQLAIVENRIHETIQRLATFDQYQKMQTDAGQTPLPRPHFVNQLIDDLCTYYSYNEFLMRKLVDLFQFGELVEFCEANEAPRPVTIRVNSLKARRKTLAEGLIQRGVNLDPIPGEWTKVGLVIYDSKVPIGATPEYLAGHYMLQGASSLLPVMALAPKPGESILDMCSAPGGKSTHIAAVMKNTGMLVANDANSKRCKAIVANMSRMGVVNAVVASVDGRKLPEAQQKYHRVLLDAPCSGTGVLSRDPSAKISKNEQDMLKITTLQKELVLAGIRCLKPDGVLVYSTCSVLVEENEQVVQYALNKCAALKLVETGLTFGVDGFGRFREHRFDAHMKYTKRFYPHQHNMDGFFVAKMRLCGPAKFDTDVSNRDRAASSKSAVPEFAQRYQLRGGGLKSNDDDVEMADDDDDEGEDVGDGRHNMRSGRDRTSLKSAAGLVTGTSKRRALREGARDRKKRKFAQNQRNDKSAASSIMGDKQREQQRFGQPAAKPTSNSATSNAGSATADSSTTLNKNLPNGVAHATKAGTMSNKLSTAEVSKPMSQTTRKEPAQLFQRVKDRASLKRRSDVGKPVGLTGELRKKKFVAGDDGAGGVAVDSKKADLAGRNSRKTINKKRF